MKQYLIDFFKYNDRANHILLDGLKQLPDKEESTRLFCHLIGAQNKWYNRITKEADDSLFPFSGQILPFDELESNWNESVNRWISFLEKLDDNGFESEVVFARPTDGKKFSAKLLDIALQINYHHIHHRAQILRLIRQQGFKPPATDYILTKLKPAE